MTEDEEQREREDEGAARGARGSGRLHRSAYTDHSDGLAGSSGVGQSQLPRSTAERRPASSARSIAVRVLGPEQFGVFTLALATASFVQLLLDTTVEEAIVKYGIRYTATSDWGRLRGLFRAGLAVKWGGGALATVVVLVLVPFSDDLFDQPDLTAPLVIAAFIPLAQAPEGIAGASMIVAGRYDLRAIYGGLAQVFRLVGVAVGSAVRRHLGGRRHPRRADPGLVRVRVCGPPALLPVPAWPAGSASAATAPSSSASSSSRASARRSSRCETRSPRSPSASSRRSTQVGYFRAAQAPITGLEALSAPVRLILLTEQTRDVEEGRIADTFRSLRRYVLGASLVALVLAPIAWVLMPWLVRVVLGTQYIPATDAARILLLAACLRLVLGWTKSFPVSIGKPGLRIVAHGVEIATLLPLVLLLGDRWGATGAAAAVLVATIAFAARLGRAALPAPARAPRPADDDGAADAVRVLVVSGIWPPDVGGPASHAPDVARFLREPRAPGRGRRDGASRVPPRSRFRSSGARRSRPVGIRHAHALALVWRHARRADVVYSTGMFGRSGIAAALARRPLVLKLTGDPAFERLRARGAVAGDVDAFQGGGGGITGSRCGSSATGCCGAPRTSSPRAGTCASS